MALCVLCVCVCVINGTKMCERETVPLAFSTSTFTSIKGSHLITFNLGSKNSSFFNFTSLSCSYMYRYQQSRSFGRGFDVLSVIRLLLMIFFLLEVKRNGKTCLRKRRVVLLCLFFVLPQYPYLIHVSLVFFVLIRDSTIMGGTHKRTHKNTHALKIHDPTRHTCLSTRYRLHSSCCGIGFLQRTTLVHSSPQHSGFLNVFRRNQIAPQVYIFHIWRHCKAFRHVELLSQ